MSFRLHLSKTTLDLVACNLTLFDLGGVLMNISVFLGIIFLASQLRCECAAQDEGSRLNQILSANSLEWSKASHDRLFVRFSYAGAVVREINSAELSAATISDVQRICETAKGRRALVQMLRVPATFTGAYVALNQISPANSIRVPIGPFRYQSIKSLDESLDVYSRPGTDSPLTRISIAAVATTVSDYWLESGFVTATLQKGCR